LLLLLLWLLLGQRNWLHWWLLVNKFLSCWSDSWDLGKQGPGSGKLLLGYLSELLWLRLQLQLVLWLQLWLLRFRK